MIMEPKVFVCLLVIPLVSSSSFRRPEKSQVLGVLEQADYSGGTGAFPTYILELLPELIAASTQIKSKDVVETLMAYMPFARKILAAQSPDRKLTVEQEKLMHFTEKVVPPMMKFVQGIYGGNGLQDLPLNAIPDDYTTDVYIKMLPDISEVINGLKKKYGGWPGTDKSLEIMNSFMPLARKAAYYHAELKGSRVSEEEQKYLAFAEKVVPPIMEYVQALYYKNDVSGQEYQIEQLVKSAVRDLGKISNRGSSAPSAGYRLPTQIRKAQAHSPVSYYQTSGSAPVAYAVLPSYHHFYG